VFLHQLKICLIFIGGACAIKNFTQRIEIVNNLSEKKNIFQKIKNHALNALNVQIVHFCEKVRHQ
jgi:hypothetical protein